MMTRVDTFFWAATLLVALGLSLIAFRSLALAADLVAGLASYVGRRFHPAAAGWLREFGVADRPVRISRVAHQPRLADMLAARWFWMIAACLAVSLFHDGLLSPTLFVVIAVAGELLRSGQRQRILTRLNEDVERLILQFEARYPLLNSVTATFAQVLDSLPGRELRFAVEETGRRLKVGQSLSDALHPMAALPNPSLRQLAVVLNHAQETDHDVFLDTLALLRRDVENRASLYHQVRQSLTLLRGTTRVLQSVLAVALLAASILPMWRDYFLQGNTVLLYAMLLVGALGSFYVEAEIRQLEV